MRPTGRPSDSFIARVRTRHPLRQVVRCLSEFSSQALRGTRIEWYPRRRPSIKKLSPAATEGDNAGLCWSSLESVPGAVLPAFFRTQRGYQPTVRLIVSDCGIIRQVAGARRFRPARAHPAGFAVFSEALGFCPAASWLPPGPDFRGVACRRCQLKPAASRGPSLGTGALRLVCPSNDTRNLPPPCPRVKAGRALTAKCDRGPLPCASLTRLRTASSRHHGVRSLFIVCSGSLMIGPQGE